MKSVCIVVVLVAVNDGRKTHNMSTKQNDLKAIAWNTGAPYTVNGQRIAAASVDGGVWFTDVDRGVSGWMAGCDLTKEGVMGLYDLGRYKSVPPPVYDLNVRQFRTSDYQDGTVDRVVRLYGEFRISLEKLALSVPTVVSESAPKGWESVEGGAR